MHRILSDRRPCFAMALVLALGAAVGAADVGWKEYGDRWEGIRGKDTAGGFQFMGVYAEPAAKVRGAEKLWVSIPLRRAARLRVRVWEPQSGYTMVPKRKTFEPGVPFSWRRAGVLEPAGIEADQLYVKAMPRDDDLELYYPARLTTAAPPDQVTRYVFRFRSGGGVDLEMTIAREEKDGLLVEVMKRRREEDLGGILDFIWDGRGKGGPEPSGVYHLKLKGTVVLKTDEHKDIDIPFVHELAAAP